MRLLLAFGLCLLVAGPAMLLWASRVQQASVSPDEDGVDQQLRQMDSKQIARLPLANATIRPADFAVFGPELKQPLRAQGDAAGLLRANLGDIDPKNADALLRLLPSDLKFADNEVTRLGSKGHLTAGLNYIMLSGDAIASKSLDTVLGRLRQEVRSIVDYRANSTVLALVDAGQIGKLRQNPDVAFFFAMPPGDKLNMNMGRTPFIESKRATDPVFRLEVSLVRGSDAASVKERLLRIPGVVDAVDYGADGSSLLVKADRTKGFGKIARIPEVLSIQEAMEMMAMNAKNSPTIQVGSAEDGQFIRPFDDAGVDGGGIDTNGDGQRNNLATGGDTVPPQLVGVLDNGISGDTPSFSQTATQVSDLTHPFPGPAHRKVHSIIPVRDTGNDCDAVLDGAGSHGNTVASVIAAYPSQLGVFATRSGIGSPGQARNSNLDGVARGARIIVSDIADRSRCTLNALVERGGNVDPGALSTRLAELICPKTGGTGTICTGITGGANEAHLAVLPFGAPDNFSTTQFGQNNGTYPQQSADIDTFLYNNRDFMVFAPVGNSGGLIGSNRLELAIDVVPDLFNGSAADEDPNSPRPIQVAPPSTAKNLVSVGVSRSDCVTFFGTSDCETRTVDFGSRGPATPESLRMAPILQAPGSDLVPSFETASIAVFRSRDADNLAPVDAQIDEGNFGTSYSAANVTGAAAIIRDYFEQGFYPTGSRTAANQVPNVSGALVKAALVASAKFNTRVETQGQDTNERNLRRTRGMDVGSPGGVAVGVMMNSEQGYGRPVLTQVLPLSNWSKEFVLNPISPSTPEHPARQLLVWDDIATGELPIDNVHTSQTHLFKVAGPRTVTGAGGGLAILRGELRIGLAWSDIPSAPLSGGPLVNDLDMTLEGPGPDNCLNSGDTKYDGSICPAGSEADNRFYDGNVYSGGGNNASLDQFSKARVVGQPALHEKRNPQEGIHINSDPNEDRNFSDSALYVGNWRLTVARGTGGSTPGQITFTAGPTTNEDTNGNRRLDAGEDTNANGLLDLPGQTYALVVSGPVFLNEAAPSRGPVSFPSSGISLDKIRYFCSDNATAAIFDSTAGAGAARSSANTTFTVKNAAGVTVDSESSISFTAAVSPAGATTSSGVPVRLGSTGVPNNGILEADTGMSIVATYAPAGQTPVSAAAQVSCSPNFVPGFFAILGNNAIGPQDALGDGCDNDDNFDANETVTYGIALTNRGRGLIGGDDYADVVATLTPSGPGAAAIRVLDSPRNMGRVPPNGVQGIYFHVFVDPTASNALTTANRVVTMNLTLDSLAKGQRISRQTYAFTHAINADRETLHYSTDFPAGSTNVGNPTGHIARDLNRNLVIDKPDQLDPFKLFYLPDEDIVFSSMFVPGVTIGGTGTVTNILGEDLNNNGVLDAGEPDIIPNGTLDRGILFSGTGPSNADKVPFAFDQNNGGWVPVRHPGSTPFNISSNPLWEYKTSGLCGFQTTLGVGKYGIWHTGDGDATTPTAASTACDNFSVPNNPQTEAQVELIFDVLHSPIIAKVNQNPDARGFSYGVEFQRLGMNLNDQVNNGAYTGGGINIDNNVDNDSTNCLLCQELDTYYTRRGGGWPYNVFAISATSQYFDTGEGIDPASSAPRQRTFGPLADTDGSINPSGATHVFNGDESGFSGFTQNTNPDSKSPIPTAPPDLLKFPAPGAPVPGVCVGGSNPGGPCQVLADCPGGTACVLEQNKIEGPVRNFEATLVGYEGGFGTETLVGTSAPEDAFFFNPGPAGTRWEIGIGFYSMENALPADYGFGVDDVVFEWDEFHPLDESAFSPAHAPACNRFNTPGNPAGGQCATITVDRTNLYECEESVEITVVDPKLPANTPSVNVSIVTDSDSVLFSTNRFTVLSPNQKLFTLAAVPGQTGLFRGNVTFSSSTNTPSNVFTNPGTDAQFIVYYVDPQCDGDRDGQAGESSFGNIDGDNVAFNVDNCPLIYNPLQEDADGDGVGNLCDNCPSVANTSQDDSNADNVGDACEYDDVDGDGVENGSDNCPDLFNDDQVGHCTYTSVTPTGPCTKTSQCTAGTGGFCDKTRGFACAGQGDLDGDGRIDLNDNCVLTSNGNQRDTDGDGLGDACDGDCDQQTVILRCSNAPATVCSVDTNCPAGGHCQTLMSHPNNANCSTVDDDADVDGVDDNLDNCAAIYNPTIIPGTKRQLDTDRDGLGDACDPAGSADDDFDGVPDDLVTFAGTNSCRLLPLISFSILSTSYQDLDGDHDIFPDTGETGRVTVTIQNTGPALSGTAFTLTSNDPDVGCITSPTFVQGNLGAGQTVTLGTLTAGQPGFQFRASNSLQTVSPANPAHVELCLSATANEALGTTAPVCFSLLADLDLPVGATQVYVNGPDGIAGTGDDGHILETFDTDKDGDGNITVNDTFLVNDAFTGQTYHGFYLHGSPTGVGQGVVAGTPCGGFTSVAEGNTSCILDPDFPMDWHLHCSPTATNCPNLETKSGIAADRNCIGNCSYQTPTDGQKAFTAPNSLHMGAHFDLSDSTFDTTHFRALQAFVSAPFNLALFPAAGDLELSMYHIVDLMDNDPGGVGPGNQHQCVDCADVQVQVDLDVNPAVDSWGTWDRLVPFQNVYDHKFQAWSVFGGYYCEFTPTDTGTAPPAPRGVHETMCYPQGAWSDCGSVRGTSATTTTACAGPGVVDPSGIGVWVQTKFNLANYLGQRIRVRWIGNSWMFDAVNSSYVETGSGWDTTTKDDGWWLDNIQVTGAITKQLTPPADPRPAPATSCPATAADNCNENAAASDKGTNPVIGVTDTAGHVIDNVAFVAALGQSLRITAIDSTLPGTCTNGVPQYRFTRNGVLAQDWSSKAFLADTPEGDTSYAVQVRCSSDFSCTSQVGASTTVKVFSGDGADIVLSSTSTTNCPSTRGTFDCGVTNDRATNVTTVSWLSRPQASPNSGYDAFRGTMTDDGNSSTANTPDSSLASLAQVSCDLAQVLPIGTNVSVSVAATPALNQAFYFLVGHSNPTAGAKDPLGRGVNNAVEIAPISCP